MKLHSHKIDEFEDLPFSVDGGHINIQIDAVSGRAWICIDGHSLLRVRGVTSVTLDGSHDLLEYQRRLQEGNTRMAVVSSGRPPTLLHCTGSFLRLLNVDNPTICPECGREVKMYQPTGSGIWVVPAHLTKR